MDVPSKNLSFVIKEWDISNPAGLVGAILFSTTVSFLHEALQVFLKVQELKLDDRRHKAHVHICLSVAYVLLTFLRFSLVLAVLSGNLWVWISLGLGAGTGYFLLRPCLVCTTPTALDDCDVSCDGCVRLNRARGHYAVQKATLRSKDVQQGQGRYYKRTTEYNNNHEDRQAQPLLIATQHAERTRAFPTVTQNTENSQQHLKATRMRERSHILLTETQKAQGSQLLATATHNAERSQPFVTATHSAERSQPLVTPTLSAERSQPLVTATQSTERLQPPVTATHSAERSQPLVTATHSAERSQSLVTAAHSAERSQSLVTAAHSAEMSQPLVTANHNAERSQVLVAATQNRGTSTLYPQEKSTTLLSPIQPCIQNMSNEERWDYIRQTFQRLSRSRLERSRQQRDQSCTSPDNSSSASNSQWESSFDSSTMDIDDLLNEDTYRVQESLKV